MLRTIAIIGGGPAGSTCGERLAAAGFRVTIFDEHLAWEKPCGGGVTWKAVERYPYLMESDAPKNLVTEVEMISGNVRCRFTLDKPVLMFSRRVLNGLLLGRARAVGCEVVPGRVTRLATLGKQVRLRIAGEESAADFVVIAAGGRNPLLPETTPLTPQDLDLTFGYFLPLDGEYAAMEQPASVPAGTGRVMKLAFPAGLGGYIWSFPRPDHLSLGICGPMAGTTSEHLRMALHSFMHWERIECPSEPERDLKRPGACMPRIFSHVLPAPRAATLRERAVCGANWALVGDAAACVDPLTGEGIYYAMRSGDLLARAIILQQPESYAAALRAECFSELERAANAAGRFFNGTFFGAPFTRRMVELLRRSESVRQVARELVSGAQGYAGLRQRLKSRGVPVLRDVFSSMFN